MTTTTCLEGRIVRKRKRSDWIVLSLDVTSTTSHGDDDRSSTDNESPNEETEQTTPVSKTINSIVSVMVSKQELWEICGHQQKDDDGRVELLDSTSRPLDPPLALYLQSIVRVHARPGNCIARVELKRMAPKFTSVITNDDLTSGSHRGGELPTSNTPWFADRVELVQCAPDPRAVHRAMSGIRAGVWPVSILSPAWWSLPTHDRDNLDQSVWNDENNNNNANKPSRTAARIARDLLDQRKSSRNRRPRTHPRDVAVLDALEGSILKWFPILESSSSTLRRIEAPTAVSTPTYLNVPDADGSLPSARGSLTRGDYLRVKKWPQVQWMVQRLQQIIFPVSNVVANDDDSADALGRSPPRILDVGGGRGDLSCALVVAGYHVTLVDRNVSSLAAAAQAAATAVSSSSTKGQRRALDVVHADFYDYAQSSSLSNLAAVVALHACGDLTDVALSYAVAQKCAFVLCPCCYTKRWVARDHAGDFVAPWTVQCRDTIRDNANNATDTDKDKARSESLMSLDASLTLGRLAELNERPDLSRRATQVLNSMRLSSVGDGYDLTLEEYDSQLSSRNLVLVGIPRRRTER